MKPKIIELACLCGARETDTGQPLPRQCWNCKKPDGMGEFPK
ncbi:hypothetical protein [Sphingobium sp. LMC3-1-1.1]